MSAISSGSPLREKPQALEENQDTSMLRVPREKPILETHFSERSNLLCDSSLMCEYVASKINDHHIAPEVSLLKKGSLIVLSIGGSGCGYVSWYPIILGVMKLNIKSKVIKVTLAGGSWVSYGSLYAWGTVEIIHDIFKIHSPVESALIKTETPLALSILYKTSIVFLGFAASLPNAYFAYKFNNQNIKWTILNIIGSWGICSYPIHNMFVEFNVPRFDFLTPFCHQSFFEKQSWNEVRSFLEFLITNCLARIPEMSQENLKDIFFQTDLLDPSNGEKRESEKQTTKRFFEKILDVYKQRTDQLKRLDSFMNSRKIMYPIKAISAVLPIANIYCNAKATLNLVGKVTSSYALKTISVTLALSPSYLTYSLNRDCLVFLIRKIVAKIMGEEEITLADIHHPRKKLIANLIATIVSLLSSSIDYATAREILSDDGTIGWIGTAASMANSLALTLLPMIILSTSLVDIYMSYRGTTEIKSKMDKAKRLEDIRFFIHNCSQTEFINFVNILMENNELNKELIKYFPWITRYQRII